MPLYIAQRGDLDRCYRCLTDRQTLKDRATQLLLKFKSGALVTQFAKDIRANLLLPTFITKWYTLEYLVNFETNT